MTLTEFLHDFRLPGVRCGGRIWLYAGDFRRDGDIATWSWCDRCRQTAVWNG